MRYPMSSSCMKRAWQRARSPLSHPPQHSASASWGLSWPRVRPEAASWLHAGRGHRHVASRSAGAWTRVCVCV